MSDDETIETPADPAVEATEPVAPAEPPADAPAPDPAPEPPPAPADVPVEDPAPADPVPAPPSADQLPDVFAALRAARSGLEDAEAGVLYCQEVGQAGLHVARALDALEARAARREASGFTGTSSA